jgi:tetratricopeptide (TPR) repeat protein
MAGDRKLQAHLLFRLSKVDFDLGNLRLALEQGMQSLKLCRELDDPWGAVYVQEHLGKVYVGLEQFKEAQQIWTAALMEAEQLHHPLVPSLKQQTGSIISTLTTASGNTS